MQDDSGRFQSAGEDGAPKHYHSFNRCFLSTLYTPGQALHWMGAARPCFSSASWAPAGAWALPLGSTPLLWLGRQVCEQSGTDGKSGLGNLGGRGAQPVLEDVLRDAFLEEVMGQVTCK